MKNLRNVAALLLVLTGLIHISLYFDMPQAPDTLAVLVFGIIYTVIGVLLFNRARFSEITGMVFPALGLLGGLLFLAPGSIDKFLVFLLLLIDLVIASFCVILMLRKEPGA